jgi:hypothetical protein
MYGSRDGGILTRRECIAVISAAAQRRYGLIARISAV